ncbi:unnamed protein product [Lathyrus oleraceus]|uniref:Protein RDM1 n=1 Tax=Pisum sativum TaxID=3888 RepID=A0A9D4YM79_PEA|nr:uncharacterized protein LOC127120946 [Pisum sativum]XP_050907525.1 uncharacterized protein LOC127120946 [Pisum sativum]KAI5440290.1 hypothetical protein KIW84_025568 [Pisum sativum]
MDKEILKKRSGEARSKRKLILNQRRPSKIRSFTEIEILHHHANDEMTRHSMTTPMSYYCKEQETSFINRNTSATMFGRSLNSSRHIIGENHHVGEPEIRSTTHLEEVEGRGACSSTAKKMSFPSVPSDGFLTNPIPNLPTVHSPISIPSIDINSPDVIIRRAAMYQDYMQQIPIPSNRGSVIPFASWMGLGTSIKKLYGQPLHYLTNTMLKQWDQMRIGSNDEYMRLDDIIHPCKAEATVWLMEQVHRQVSSHIHIANLWKKDYMHNGYVDSICPTLQHTS